MGVVWARLEEIMDDLRTKVGHTVPGLEIETAQLMEDLIGDLSRFLDIDHPAHRGTSERPPSWRLAAGDKIFIFGSPLFNLVGLSLESLVDVYKQRLRRKIDAPVSTRERALPFPCPDEINRTE
jgi:hypothetical protein